LQSFPVPGIVGHVQLLEQELPDARESVRNMRVGSMDGDRGIVVIEGASQPQRRDRWAEAPSEVPQPLDEMRCQPEIVGAELPIVLAFAERRIGILSSRRSGIV
jgi:hypothetical protein